MIRHLTTGVRHISTVIADAAGRPLAQIAVLLVCGAWLVDGGDLDRLAASVSIGSFVLTQMVLHQQRRREAALHLKIDEMILAIGGARNEVTGLEHRTEEEIESPRATANDDVVPGRRALAGVAPLSPTPHRSDRFHSAGPRDYAAHGRSGST